MFRAWQRSPQHVKHRLSQSICKQITYVKRSKYNDFIRSCSGRRSPRACAALVSPSQAASGGWQLWSALALCAAVSQVVEKRTPFGAVLSAPLVSMIAALALAAVGVIPTVSPAYDAVWTYLMPLAAALCLLESDLRKLRGAAASTLAAFLIGAAGTVLGTLVAFGLLGSKLGPDGYKVAAALCASYIGGSVNFAAVAQALGLAPGPLLAGAMTADNMAMAVYIAVIMSIPATQVQVVPPAAAPLERRTPHASPAALSSTAQAAGPEAAAAPLGEVKLLPGPQPGELPLRAAADPTPLQLRQRQAQAFTAENAALALAAACMACTLGNRIAGAIKFASGGLAVMAVLASGMAMAGAAAWKRMGSSGAPSPFSGSEALGGALMMLFFATIGAGAGSLSALQGCWWLLAFIAVQLAVHLAVCLGVGRLLQLPMQSVLIASNANVGGSATAAAMASAKQWHHMVQPAMLTGSLGYAIATAIGTAMGHWLRARGGVVA